MKNIPIIAKIILKKKFFNLDFENEKSENIIDTLASKGNSSFLLNESTPFSPTLEKKYTEITTKHTGI